MCSMQLGAAMQRRSEKGYARGNHVCFTCLVFSFLSYFLLDYFFIFYPKLVPGACMVDARCPRHPSHTWNE